MAPRRSADRGRSVSTVQLPFPHPHMNRRTVSFFDPGQHHAARSPRGYCPAVAAVQVERVPLFQQVRERLRCTRGPRQHLYLCLYLVAERLHQRNGLLFSFRQPLVCRAAAFFRLDGIQFSDALQHFGCDVGRCAGMLFRPGKYANHTAGSSCDPALRSFRT